MQKSIERQLLKRFEKVGSAAVARSRVTKTYIDRTRDLRESHFSETVEPKGARSVTFSIKKQQSTEILTSPPGVITLYLGARMGYGVYVYFKGFAVVDQEFKVLKAELQREFRGVLSTRQRF